VLHVRSLRYANRSLRVGRLLLVFRGEVAEVPDWARREYEWLLARIPGVAAYEPPRVAPAAEPVRAQEPVEAPPVVAEATEAARPRPGGRKGR
jgi:hypothetical protein